MYRFSAILIKTEMADFKRIGRNNFKVSIDTQRIPHRQSNLEKKGKKKKKAGGILLYFMISDHTAKLQPSKLYGNGSFPGSPVIGLHTSTAEVYVQSLDGELRSHMPQCKKTQKFH